MSSNNTPTKRDSLPPSESVTPRVPTIPNAIEEEGDEDEPGSPDTVRPSYTIAGSRREYGTIETTDQGTVRHRTSLRSASPTNFSPISPQHLRPKLRPTASRRPSARSKALPYRGEHFSVDDDPSEVEDDLAESFPTLKRQASNVRRRNTQAQPPPSLSRVPTRTEPREAQVEEQASDAEQGESEENNLAADDELEDDDEDTLSDAESFTLKDRQIAINETHPFGIRIWKPALYKKNRSVEKNAEDDIHSSPSQIVSRWLWLANSLWTIFFGWWLAVVVALAGLICFLLPFESSAAEYGRVFLGLAGYLFWPFGKFVKLEQDDNYVEEDEGEGRSISEYERWQSGDLEYGRLMFGPTLGHTGSLVGRHRNSVDSATERASLLGRSTRSDQAENGASNRTKRRLFGRGQWTLGRVVFFGFFYFLIAPLMLFVSLLCWFLVFTVPMGRVLLILFYHLRKRPLSLSFHPDVSYVRDTTKPSSILLCTYRAAGLKYWKYTVDGTNIFLINFLLVVVFVIFDWFVLKKALGLEIWLTSPALLFIMALISIIPLAYFIGQAVASISAQSTMGVGAAVNAFFSTIVEVYLYCIALNEGKGQLVEGSVIGSIFAGILLLPGLSMCFGAIKRKTQRFNVKSAGATTTMLLFALIATFGPTLFYKIYGAHELICKTCGPNNMYDEPRDCRQCYFRQAAAITDDFFIKAVRPYCWIAAFCLFLSYLVGLLFTLRTHAAVIWTTDIDEKKPGPLHTADVSPLDTRGQSLSASQALPVANGSHIPRSNIRDSQLYKRILGKSLQSAGLPSDTLEETFTPSGEDTGVDAVDQQTKTSLPHVVPPKSSGKDSVGSITQLPIIPGLSEEDHSNLVHQVAEMAATAATIAARDAVQHPRSAAYQATHSVKHDSMRSRRSSALHVSTAHEDAHVHPGVDSALHPTQPGNEAVGGGHDAPNWSRTKSSVILLTATVAYAIVAEVLVNTVDVVLSSVDIDEKFLGITLFALVPNTTEFLNAISFAMNGNIALSMEIGSAYALQVCLLQIPALVLFSAVHGQFIDPADLLDHTFNLIFPQWDMVTVILCVFLLSYVYGEGKSNYFKGSILVLTYLVVLAGFWFSGFTSMDSLGVDTHDTLAIASNGWMQMQGMSQSSSSIKRTEL